MKLFKKWSDWELHETFNVKSADNKVTAKYEVYKRTKEDGLVDYKQVKVFDNQEQYKNMEHLRKDLIIASGFYETRYNFEGVEIYEAESISFSSMDETKFNDLYNSVVNTICKYFHFDKDELINEVAQYF